MLTTIITPNGKELQVNENTIKAMVKGALPKFKIKPFEDTERDLEIKAQKEKAKLKEAEDLKAEKVRVEGLEAELAELKAEKAAREKKDAEKVEAPKKTKAK